MKFKSIDEILGFAIEKEKEAVAFYTDLSKRQTTDALTLTFRELAQEEAKHVKLLTTISKNQTSIKAYELKKVPNLKISDYLVDIEYTEGMIMQDILVLAMKREEMAVKLYTQLAMGAADPESAKLFKLLVQEESKHKLTFEKLYDDSLAGGGN